MTFSTRPFAAVPTVTVEQMREVDRLMVEEAGISLPQMMENAGRSLAAVVMTRDPGSPVTVLAGSGGNGGGGLVAARHLTNRGVDVAVTMASDQLSPVTEMQLDIVREMGVPISGDPAPSAVVIDALIGYSLSGDPRGRTAELIEWANSADCQLVSLDVPSGVDATTGGAFDPAVAATATMTIALPKTGLGFSDLVGDLYLTDISVPITVYATLGVAVPPDLFSSGQVLRLT